MATRETPQAVPAPSRTGALRLLAAGLGAACIIGALAFSTLRPVAPTPMVDSATTDDTAGGKALAAKPSRNVAEKSQRREPKSHRLPFPSQFGV